MSDSIEYCDRCETNVMCHQERKCMLGDCSELPDTACSVGDYVLATKYSDGDPQDHWAIGFFAGITAPHYDPPRYDVVDGEGNHFRGNGFRRVKKISKERGEWMLKHAREIELSGRSVWHFARCKMF